MQILNPEIDIDIFYESIAKCQKRALLLDYDGTLAPFRKDRDKAFPYPGVRDVLAQIIRDCKTRVVVISGRSLETLGPLLDLKQPPELWGSHGGERLLPDGTFFKETLSEVAYLALESIAEYISSIGWDNILEKKPLGLAIHWRGLGKDKIQEIEKGVMDKVPTNLEGLGLLLHRFDGGLELRPKVIAKGNAVKTIFKEMGHDAVVAYLGDDLTDEDAFKAIKNQGLGILVRDDLRVTNADLWLRPPDELLVFLQRWVGAETCSKP